MAFPRRKIAEGPVTRQTDAQNVTFTLILRAFGVDMSSFCVGLHILAFYFLTVKETHQGLNFSLMSAEMMLL